MDLLKHEIEYHWCEVAKGILTVRRTVKVCVGLTVLISPAIHPTSITAQTRQNGVPRILQLFRTAWVGGRSAVIPEDTLRCRAAIAVFDGTVKIWVSQTFHTNDTIFTSTTCYGLRSRHMFQGNQIVN